MIRITSNQELEDFAIQKYNQYRKAFMDATDMVSKYYLNDILSDFLVIQNFAHNQIKDPVKEVPQLASLSICPHKCGNNYCSNPDHWTMYENST